jgi:hypothetical protein
MIKTGAASVVVGSSDLLSARVSKEPQDVVELLRSLDQILFAARLAGEAGRLLSAARPEEAGAALDFVLEQLDAAVDRLRDFAPHSSTL